MMHLGNLLVGVAVALLFAAWSTNRARGERRDVVLLCVAAGVLAVPAAAILVL